MQVASTKEGTVSYQERKERRSEDLRHAAEAATLEKVRRREAVGRLPLGYEYGPDGTAQVDPSRERLLREAFLLAAEGRRSVRQVLAEVTRRGLRGRGGRPLDASMSWRVLTNPFYVGLVTYRGEALPGRHAPLVSAETFATTQKNCRERSKMRNKKPKA